jgi:peptide chain release factor 2
LAADPNLWDNQEKAQKLMSEKNILEEKLDRYENFLSSVKEYEEMEEFAESENDEAMLGELFENLSNLQNEVNHAKLEALLSGEADANDTYLEIHAGSGGTEAMDWIILHHILDIAL